VAGKVGVFHFKEVIMLVMDRPVVENTDKARRNVEYLTGLDESFKQAEADKKYTFSMEDMEAFADGELNKEQFLARAK
jgi:hypothetical protein